MSNDLTKGKFIPIIKHDDTDAFGNLLKIHLNTAQNIDLAGFTGEFTLQNIKRKFSAADIAGGSLAINFDQKETGALKSGEAFGELKLYTPGDKRITVFSKLPFKVFNGREDFADVNLAEFTASVNVNLDGAAVLVLNFTAGAMEGLLYWSGARADYDAVEIKRNDTLYLITEG